MKRWLPILLAMILGNPFDSPERPDLTHSVPARADAVHEAGRIVALDADGYAADAADAAGRIVLGRVRARVDATGRADGDVLVPFDVGVFAFANDAANPVLRQHYGRPVFIKDNATVSASPGTNNVFAGFARGFTASQVWVDMKVLPLLAGFFGNHPSANFRISVSAGLPVFQLYNQTRARWQTVQLSGSAGAEHLIIAA